MPPSKLHKILTRARLALRQNRAPVAFVAAWLAANAAVFARVLHMAPANALLVTACITKMPGGWPGAYQSFTEVVVFGLVASVVVTNVTQRYRPEETCRALAARSSKHVVVVGFTNLGRRVFELVSAAGKSVVVVEEDAAKVAALVRDEHAIVVGSGRDASVLADAGVASAAVVVIATDDLETAAVACRVVRELNAECELVVRCADADVAAVLAKTYTARPVSTSRLAASFVDAQARKARVRSAVVLGMNEVGARVAEALEHSRIATSHVEVTEDTAALAAAGVGAVDLVVVCDDDLGKNLIRVDRIRDLDARTKVICRAFHEDAALVLTRPPFRCSVFSTSKHAAEMLARGGAFRAVGIDDAPDASPAASPAAA